MEEFQGTIGRTLAESTPWWPDAPHPGEAAPNVVPRKSYRHTVPERFNPMRPLAVSRKKKRRAGSPPQLAKGS